MTVPPQYTYKFRHDKYGRLDIADNTNYDSWDIGVSNPTSYDSNGNITQLQRASTGSKTYTYQSGKNVIQSVGTWNFTADVTGNITSSGSQNVNFLYDPFTMMTKSATQGSTILSYQYDGRKERVYRHKSTDGSKILYLHGLSDFPIMQKLSSGDEATFVYGKGGLVAARLNSTWYYIMRDHLGSTRLVVNTSGTPVERYDYDPYGKIVESVVSPDTKYLFTGQELEGSLSATSFWNFRARFYDSDIALFYAGDPVKQTWSPFGYAGNNPAVYVDNDGRIFGIDDLLLAMAIGGVIGGGVSGMTYAIMARGDFSWGDFGRAFAYGAVGGAVSGGFGYAFAGTSLANSLAGNILSTAASYSASAAIMGDPITLNAMIGATAGGILGGFLPDYQAIDGGSVENILAEAAYSTAKGSFSGGVGGGISSLLSGRDFRRGYLTGASWGAAGGFAQSIGLIGILGPGKVPDAEKDAEAIFDISAMNADMATVGYGAGAYGPIYRSGGLLDLFTDRGFAFGRNLFVPETEGKDIKINGEWFNYRRYTYVHETAHFYQQVVFGWPVLTANSLFYGNYSRPGNAEWGANQLAYIYMKR